MTLETHVMRCSQR